MINGNYEGYEELPCVDREALEAVAALWQEQLRQDAEKKRQEQAQARGGQSGGTNYTSAYDVPAFISRNGLPLKEEKEDKNGGRMYVLAECPFNSEHTNDPAITQWPSGAIKFHCFHASCSGNNWHALRALYRDSEPKREKAPPTGNGSTIGGEPRFRVQDLPLVRNCNSKGVTHTVDRVIPERSVVLFTGESGHGKSTLLLDVAKAVASGGMFAGRQCQQREVLILDRENPVDAITERFDRLKIPEGEAGIHYWGGWVEEDVPDPCSPVVLEWVNATEPASAFIDGDENSAKDVRRFMDGPRRLANMGCSVGLLHNTGKADSAKDYRGSSDFKASADVAYLVYNFGGTELTKVRLSAFKTRVLVDREIILEYTGHGFAAVAGTHAAVRTVTEYLTDLLRANPGVTTTQFVKLAIAAHLGKGHATDYLINGARAGEIAVNPGPRNTRYHTLIWEAK